MTHEERNQYHLRVHDLLAGMCRNSRFVMEEKVHPDNMKFFRQCAEEHIRILNIGTIRENGDRLWVIEDRSGTSVVRCDFADGYARTWHHKYMLNNIDIPKI